MFEDREPKFVDRGIFYASQEMMDRVIVLSTQSGLFYDIENEDDVKIISLVSENFLKKVEQEVMNDTAAFLGSSCVVLVNGKLIWDY